MTVNKKSKSYNSKVQPENVEPEWEFVVAQLKAGSISAYRSVRTEFYHPLQFLSFNIIGNYTVAKMIVDSTLMELYMLKESINAPEGVVAFLYSIVARSSFEFYQQYYKGITDKTVLEIAWDESQAYIQQQIQSAHNFQLKLRQDRKMLTLS